MTKFILALFVIENILLIAIFLSKKMNRRKKRKRYKVKKLSEMKGKEFGEYMDYLTKDL